jgi:hypothetical protein
MTENRPPAPARRSIQAAADVFGTAQDRLDTTLGEVFQVVQGEQQVWTGGGNGERFFHLEHGHDAIALGFVTWEHGDDFHIHRPLA